MLLECLTSAAGRCVCVCLSLLERSCCSERSNVTDPKRQRQRQHFQRRNSAANAAAVAAADRAGGDAKNGRARLSKRRARSERERERERKSCYYYWCRCLWLSLPLLLPPLLFRAVVAVLLFGSPAWLGSARLDFSLARSLPPASVITCAADSACYPAAADPAPAARCRCLWRRRCCWLCSRRIASQRQQLNFRRQAGCEKSRVRCRLNKRAASSEPAAARAESAHATPPAQTRAGSHEHEREHNKSTGNFRSHWRRGHAEQAPGEPAHR